MISGLKRFVGITHFIRSQQSGFISKSVNRNRLKAWIERHAKSTVLNQSIHPSCGGHKRIQIDELLEKINEVP